MARPVKNNADYFTHDSDMRNDAKIRALRRKFGCTGYAVWCFILESLTDADFFRLEIDDVSLELLAGDYDVTTDILKDIIDYSLKIGLLQRDDGMFYSEKHQSRLKNLIQYREKRRQNGVMNVQNPDKTNNDEEMNVQSTQSKRESKSKRRGEESKVKITKVIYQDIVDLWNSICLDFPKVQALTDKRKQKIQTRLQEMTPDPEQYIETATALFQRIQASDFLRGNNGNRWAATFDWVFSNSENWVKITEGNYDNRSHASVPTQAPLTLGADEYIDSTGRRTYGSGKVTVPINAPARPSARYWWNDSLKQWNL